MVVVDFRNAVPFGDHSGEGVVEVGCGCLVLLNLLVVFLYAGLHDRRNEADDLSLPRKQREEGVLTVEVLIFLLLDDLEVLAIL